MGELTKFLIRAGVFFVLLRMCTVLFAPDFTAIVYYEMFNPFHKTKSWYQKIGIPVAISSRVSNLPWSMAGGRSDPACPIVESLYLTLLFSGIASWFYGWLLPILIARLLSMIEEAPTDIMEMKVKNTNLHLPLMPLRHPSSQNLLLPSDQHNAHHMGDVVNFIEVRVGEGPNQPMTITRGYSINADITPMQVRFAGPGPQSLAICSEGRGMQALPAEVKLNPTSPCKIFSVTDLKVLQDFDPLSESDDSEFKSATSSNISMTGSDTSAGTLDEVKLVRETSRGRKMKCHKSLLKSSANIVEATSERRSLSRDHPLALTTEATSKPKKPASITEYALSMTEAALKTKEAISSLGTAMSKLLEASSCFEEDSTCSEKDSTISEDASTCTEDALDYAEEVDTTHLLPQLCPSAVFTFPRHDRQVLQSRKTSGAEQEQEDAGPREKKLARED